MDVLLTGPSECLPRCSICSRAVAGVVVFAVGAGNRITHCYEAQCHGAKATMVKLDGIERLSVTDERHRCRLQRWDPFPTN